MEMKDTVVVEYSNSIGGKKRTRVDQRVQIGKIKEYDLA